MYEWDFPPKYKTCSLCGESKELKEFFRNKGGEFSRAARCKVCYKSANLFKRGGDKEFEFMCGKCGHMHKLKRVSIAQLSIGMEVIIECHLLKCRGITKITPSLIRPSKV